jgi:hypothetical protein
MTRNYPEAVLKKTVVCGYALCHCGGGLYRHAAMLIYD